MKKRDSHNIVRRNSAIKGLTIAVALAACLPLMAQNSAPAPGSGGSFNPAPANGIGWNPGPGYAGPGAMWGNGPAWGCDPTWGPSWNSSPTIIVNASYPASPNNGVTNVMACGYDATGVWRTLPLTVEYSYNGVQYNVEVLNAWNPWTSTWSRGVDEPAYATSYFLNGTTFDYYTVLPTGTFYFNL